MVARLDPVVKRRRKELFTSLREITGWTYRELADRLGVSPNTVNGFVRVDPKSNAPTLETLQLLSDNIVDRAGEILAQARLREVYKPLSRVDFEEGVSQPNMDIEGSRKEVHGLVSGGPIVRVRIVGQTGPLGYASVRLDGVAPESRTQHLLDAAWETFQYWTAPKSKADQQNLVEETLQRISSSHVDIRRFKDPFVQVSDQSWQAEIYTREGITTLATGCREGETEAEAIARIVDVAWANYHALLKGIDSRILADQERTVRKARYRANRVAFGLPYEQVAKWTGKTLVAVKNWGEQLSPISPNKPFLDILDHYIQDWASKVILAAEQKGGKLSPEEVAEIKPLLPNTIARDVKEAMAEYEVRVEDHWRRSAMKAKTEIDIPEGVPEPY